MLDSFRVCKKHQKTIQALLLDAQKLGVQGPEARQFCGIAFPPSAPKKKPGEMGKRYLAGCRGKCPNMKQQEKTAC